MFDNPYCLAEMGRFDTFFWRPLWEPHETYVVQGAPQVQTPRSINVNGQLQKFNAFKSSEKNSDPHCEEVFQTGLEDEMSPMTLV